MHERSRVSLFHFLCVILKIHCFLLCVQGHHHLPIQAPGCLVVFLFVFFPSFFESGSHFVALLDLELTVTLLP